MSGFPLTDPKQFPLPLDLTLRVLGERGHIEHLSISRTADHEWQVSCRPVGEKGYRVSIGPCLIETLLKAIGPSYDRKWHQLLGEEYEAAFDAVEEDDLEDVLG